jgi:hypothetical protein
LEQTKRKTGFVERKQQPYPTNASLIFDSCSSDGRFAADFLQILPGGGHPCLKLMATTAFANWDLNPRSCQCWATHTKCVSERIGHAFIVDSAL